MGRVCCKNIMRQVEKHIETHIETHAEICPDAEIRIARRLQRKLAFEWERKSKGLKPA